MLCLREVHTPYASGRWAHRLWVMLPLVGLMAFAVVLGGRIDPKQPLGKDFSDAEVTEAHTDAGSKPGQYFRISPISRPWILTRSGPKMRVL